MCDVAPCRRTVQCMVRAPGTQGATTRCPRQGTPSTRTFRGSPRWRMLGAAWRHKIMYCRGSVHTAVKWGRQDLQLSGNPGMSLVPYEPREQAASVDGYDPGQSFGSYQQTQESLGGGSVGTAASASVAAAASVLTHAAMSAAQQSAIAGQQAQQATAAECSCGAACPTGVQCGRLSAAAYTNAAR